MPSSVPQSSSAPAANRPNETFWSLRPKELDERPLLVAILRVRNEELILRDTLAHLSGFCDGIVAYDDASTDATFSILRSHPKVWAVVRNFHWQPAVQDRLESETSHRGALLRLAESYSPEWVMCADADERFVGDMRGFLLSSAARTVDAIRIQLFDAYMTPQDRAPFMPWNRLLGFRRFFGVERRDILMLWRPRQEVRYEGLDRREPVVHFDAKVETRFFCQHYGKSISEAQWEATCDYYVKHFPYESYGRKWEARRGKSVHEQSDFGTPLYPWDEVITRGVRIHP